MLFNYTAINAEGSEQRGSIDAISVDVAISSLQRRGLVISAIDPADKRSVFEMNIAFFERVSNKDLVILSRQIATLFEAQVSALRAFRLIGAEATKPIIGRIFLSVAEDLQGGSSVSKALARHPEAFSDFYVNMVRAGEESGKLDATFLFLADYLDRTYDVTSKARSALVYPAFVLLTFLGVMILLLTTVIPKLAGVLEESGQDVPLYTKIVLGISQIAVDYGLFFIVALIIGLVALWRFSLTETGKYTLDQAKLAVPYTGALFQKLYLSRIADNMNTMLSSGIPMLQALEITSSVVGNHVYREILDGTGEQVKIGVSVSEALGRYSEIPGIFIQMVKVGEETGQLGRILSTLSKFYRREVTNAVDSLVSLIEPALIVSMGLGVGFLLASVLIPIYNISASF